MPPLNIEMRAELCGERIDGLFCPNCKLWTRVAQVVLIRMGTRPAEVQVLSTCTNREQGD